MARPAKLLFDARAELGEGPRWHRDDQRLYWVDIAANALHRLDPATGRNETRTFADPVACFAFRHGGGLLLAMREGFATIDDWDAAVISFGDAPLRGMVAHRFNDGRTDSAGHFWVGSVDSAKSAHDAALYRLAPDGKATFIEGGMLTCNGAAFSSDGDVFMHTDTPSHALRRYGVVDGELSNRSLFHQFPLGFGRPDGGSFDLAGNYWTALFDGGRVVCLNPEGEIIEEVLLPVSRPTMIVFGGADGCTAFVTSARIGLDATTLAAQPLAGGIFKFRVDVPGVSEHLFGVSVGGNDIDTPLFVNRF